MSTAPALPPLPKNRFRLWVNDDGAKELRAYKYAGVDLSYIYVHILTPMNNFLVQFIPDWIAPNLITLSGLFLCMACHYVVWLHSPDWETPLPGWVNIYVAFTLWAYQTVDNLDGKQARKTGNGSALGLLFDHGVDALNTTIMTHAFAPVLQVGQSWRLAFLWFCTYCPFVFATWEEYYTHCLTLSEINGPTDGVLFSCLLCFCAAIWPGMWARPCDSFWVLQFTKDTVAAKWPVHTLVIAGSLIVVFITVYTNARRVVLSASGREAGLVTAFSKLWPFVQLLGSFVVWALLSPTDIYHVHTRLFFFAIGILFASLICKLMLAHLMKQDYRIFRTSLFPLTAAVLNAVGGRWATPATPKVPLLAIDELQSLYVVLALGVVSWVLFVFPVIWELTTVLNIRCFVVKPKVKST